MTAKARFKPLLGIQLINAAIGVKLGIEDGQPADARRELEVLLELACSIDSLLGAGRLRDAATGAIR